MDQLINHNIYFGGREGKVQTEWTLQVCDVLDNKYHAVFAIPAFLLDQEVYSLNVSMILDWSMHASQHVRIFFSCWYILREPHDDLWGF